MKKFRIFLILSALICAALSASAQLRYGFRFAGEFAAPSLKHAPDWSLRNGSGFSGGLALEYQMPRCGFAADIAVLYTRYNTRLVAPSAAPDVLSSPQSFGRNYIDVPLHLKYKFWLAQTKDLFGPMLYTGPSLMMRLDHKDAMPLSTKTLQPGWDLGIGFDIVNFIQITGGYRFALSNSIKSFPLADATLHTGGWNIAATLLFDF